LIRRAVVKDAKEIQGIIKFYGDKGTMLHRSLNEIYENIRDFTVYDDNGTVTGISSLHIDWEDLAEIRSLAVREDAAGRGIGTHLVKACLQEAEEMGIKRVFSLTYVPDFFLKFSFRIVEKSEFPHKVWGDCVNCTKFPECDEIALIYEFGKGNSLK